MSDTGTMTNAHLVHFSSSNFQTLKIFVTLFSETVRPTKLKLGAHMKCGRCMVYTIFCLSLYFFIFLSNSQSLTIFITLFSGTVKCTKLKLGRHGDNGRMYCVYRNQTLLHVGKIIMILTKIKSTIWRVTLFLKDFYY